MADPAPPPATPGWRWWHDVLVCALIVVALLAIKRPALLCPIELNVDESQLIVQATRYERDIVPWRAVDGTSSGPITPWVLLAAHQVGVPFSYPGARLVGLLALGCVVATTYLSLRRFAPRREAALVAGLGLFVLGGAISWDFMELTSEQVPAAALALGTCAAIWAAARPRGALTALMAAGLLAGAVPWAKLQGVPPAAALGVVLLWQAWQVARVRGVAGVLIALVLPSVAILALVVAGGAWRDFWQSYIVANASYAGAFTWRSLGVRERIVFFESEISGLLQAVVLLGVVVVLRRHAAGAAPQSAAQRLAGVLALLGAVAALFCCIRPQTVFPHYRIWLIGPLLLSAGVLLRQAVASAARGWKFAAFACLLGPVAMHAARYFEEWRFSQTEIARFTATADANPARFLARAIRTKAPNARTLAVWGWMPALYLESGLRCTTRHAIGHYLIEPGPSRDYLRSTFLADLRTERPDVIVDAVASGAFTWLWEPKDNGIESFPAFAAYVGENYVLVAKPTMDPTGTPLRIFVRRDLAK